MRMMNDECRMMKYVNCNSWCVMRVLQIVFAIFISLSFIVPVYSAQDNAGSNSGISLRFSPSVRAAAMGDAFTAEARGVSAAYYNPAGLGWTEQKELLLSYQNLVLDVGQGSLGYAHPLSNRSAWAILGQYVNYGSTQRTIVSGTAGAYSGTFSGQDIAVGISYGAKMGNWGYGVTAKILSSEIDNTSATAFAGDIGLRWQADNSPLAFGIAVNNLGTELKYDREAERLPILFRAGASWEAIHKRLIITGDLEKVVDENWSGHAGAEFKLGDMFAFRAGYDGSVEIDNGLTLGAGFKTNGLELDYAFIPFGKVRDNHRVGLNYKF